MGATLGLLFGIGVLLVWRGSSRTLQPPRRTRRARSSVAELLTQAGLPMVTPRQLQMACAVIAVTTATLVGAVSRSVALALAFGAFAAYGPVALLKMRRRRRLAELRVVWPDVVDNLMSAVRAGLSLPEAVAQLAVRGPEPLREPFQ